MTSKVENETPTGESAAMTAKTAAVASDTGNDVVASAGDSALAGGDDAPTRKTLSLSGSAKLVSEFFAALGHKELSLLTMETIEYGINSILYQRGIYHPEDFKTVRKYGLNMLVALDDDIKHYIKKVMLQLSKWMQVSKISALVLAITNKYSQEIVERWQFDVQIDGKPASGVASQEAATFQKDKSEEQIQTEIRDLIRQITATVTFLPQIAGECTFNVLVYADPDSDVPTEWEDSDAKLVRDGELVQLRSFSTNKHRVGIQVAYRID